MTYEIDQSGKIEQTEKDTILAFTNGNACSIMIPRRVKRQLQEIFRLCGFTRLFIYYLFSVGVFFLISNLKKEEHIVIDIEYSGKDKLLSSIIIKLLENYKKPVHNIIFSRIGNHPKVHYAAKDVFDKKRKADKILTLHEALKAIKKTDGRLRECLSTLVDAQPRSRLKIYHKKNQKSSIKP